MKKASVLLVVLIIAIVIVGAIGVVPLAFFKSCNEFYKFNIPAGSSEYQVNLKYALDSSTTDIAKNNILNMDRVINDVFLKMNRTYFWMAEYLIIAISIILIAIGIYFIKNEACKNYVGTSFIIAACMLLAFSVIIAICLYI